MTFHRFTLFRLFGMSVRGDIGWLFIAGLVTWSLTAGVFPFAYPGHTAAAYLVMGIIGAAGLFASILFHEFSHALVARAHGIEMQGITLWIFGGVAETSEEPDQPRSELKIAAIGPASSFVLGASFLALDVSGYALGWSTKITGVLDYLTWANLALAIFNLIPAFPLDGGRILRALIWARSRNLVAATRTASTVGSGFGAGLMLLGVLAGFGGNIVGGVWWILIGSFLRSAARGSFEQLLVREALSHATVRTLMDAHPPTVQADTTVEDFVSNFVLARGGAARVPVAEDGALWASWTSRRCAVSPRRSGIATRCGSSWRRSRRRRSSPSTPTPTKPSASSSARANAASSSPTTATSRGS